MQRLSAEPLPPWPEATTRSPRRTQRQTRILVGVLALLVTLPLLTGCGRLNKKDFIKKGDAICRQTNATAAKTPIPSKTDIRATADYLRSNSKLLIAQADRLDALKPPKQDEPRLRDVFNRERDALNLLQTAANQYQLGDPETAQATANNAGSALIVVRQDLQGYGFQDCANQ